MMISFVKTYLWLFLPILLLYNFEKRQAINKTILHDVLINHPGEKKPVNAILQEIQNEDGYPVQYVMDVYSVICLKQVCKEIPVTLYWNNIGEYQKYKIAKGRTLEKYEADLFEPEDYLKIQSIMANPNSPFKDVYYDEILSVPQESDIDDLDAVSGPTALELDEKDTVPGAALTCYTLWHWANGEVVSKIKNITGKSLSLTQLQDFILKENETYFNIAINELNRRDLFSKEIIDTIILKVLKDEALLKKAFGYFEKAPSELYYDATKRLFFEGSKKQKLVVIQSLQNASDVPKIQLDDLSTTFGSLSSYQEVSMLLNLMEKKQHYSEILLNNVVPLLESDFLIARRVYWFLKNHKALNANEQDLEVFYQKNKSRL
ncbi:hypothetical protein H7U19_12260 [Hyunsoonleella sp. SJ7]|uniref:Uncharacterized protein n=1 Tax=Hyunsoonleella aquatilis TaxID=2762758 RepID=A0A923KML2_9FLAO|nr:hypothetical protein [Hyunsoonleella aquatilis]MBC3759185.1 hypothetical protein [Hyunsoonleella aquatilis]